jgi:hypothetical protein
MNQNVNPVLAVFIIGVALTLLGGKFWAQQQALHVGGPDQMQYDPKGHLFIHVSDTLYELSPSGEWVQEYDLNNLGMAHLVGNFAFFSNGDLLIRRGKYNPGFLDGLLAFLRIRNTKPPISKDGYEGLVRCRLNTMQCTPFGNSGVDFDFAFHMNIDRESDTVYIADTSRHMLRKYDASVVFHINRTFRRERLEVDLKDPISPYGKPLKARLLRGLHGCRSGA